MQVIETTLLLFEARYNGFIIIVCDTEFAHEIPDDYENVLFFEPKDSHALTECMQNVMGEDYSFESNPTVYRSIGCWDDVVADILRNTNKDKRN